jgi:probable F420-dependent oxidoreductase
VARRAEELGYHSLWSFQRLLSPVDGAWGEYYRSVHDPLIPLAYVAAVTNTIRLGTAVVNLPFINPAILAKQVSSLDVLSGGRVDLGLGNGWSDEEFAAAGVTKQRRGRRAEDFVATLKALWGEEVSRHEGPFYRVPESSFQPKPVQRPHPPILLGGGSETALRRAGRLCDGWISGSQMDPGTISGAITAVKAAAVEAGRDPSSLRYVTRGAIKVRQDAGPGRKPLTGTVEQIRTDFADYAALGVTELFIDLNFDPEIGTPDADPQESTRRAERVLEEFAPG